MLGVQELQLCSPTDGTTNMCSAGKQLTALITQVGKLHRSWGKAWEESYENNKKVNRNGGKKKEIWQTTCMAAINLFVINLNCECTAVDGNNNTEVHSIPSECQMWTIHHLILMSLPYLTTLCIHFLHCQFPPTFHLRGHGSFSQLFTIYQPLKS